MLSDLLRAALTTIVFVGFVDERARQVNLWMGWLLRLNLSIVSFNYCLSLAYKTN